MTDKSQSRLRPYLMNFRPPRQRSETAQGDGEIKLRTIANPLAGSSLSAVGIATRVSGPDRFDETLLIQPYEREQVRGIREESIRVFRFEGRSSLLRPIWNSGVEVVEGHVWSKIRRPGVYVPVGLPLDKVLAELLHTLARERALTGPGSPEEDHELTNRVIDEFLALPGEAIAELRILMARLEFQTGRKGHNPEDFVQDTGGHILTFPLPHDRSWDEVEDQLRGLETPQGGLPEEALFYPPEFSVPSAPPWQPGMSELTWDGLDARQWDRLRRFDLLKVLEFYPWFQSNDWWMYQHDVAHSGRASGWSDIRAANAGNLVEHRKVAVDGPIITKPAIVDGTVYVGSGKTGGGNGGTLYKIDLYTGTVEGRYPTSGHGHAFYTWYEGIGGSPAVVGNRVYFTGVHGKVYCLDTATMTPQPAPPPRCLDHRPQEQQPDHPGQESAYRCAEQCRLMERTARCEREGLCRLW